MLAVAIHVSRQYKCKTGAKAAESPLPHYLSYWTFKILPAFNTIVNSHDQRAKRSLGRLLAVFVYQNSWRSIPCKTQHSSRCFTAFIKAFVCSLKIQKPYYCIQQLLFVLVRLMVFFSALEFYWGQSTKEWAHRAPVCDDSAFWILERAYPSCSQHVSVSCFSGLCHMLKYCAASESGKHGELLGASQGRWHFLSWKKQIRFPSTQTEGIRVVLYQLPFLQCVTQT